MTQQFRRTFLKNGLVTAGAFSSISSAFRSSQGYIPDQLRVDIGIEPDVHALLNVAIDTALAAGATYVDCRFTHTLRRSIINIGVSKGEQVNAQLDDLEDITVGVRSLVAGYWGMASSPLANQSEMVRLAQESVSLAKGGAVTGLREVVLADRPVVKNGTWTMPVEIDPFSIHPSEVIDRLGGLCVFGSNFPLTVTNGVTARFRVQTKFFVASDGCSFSQKTYLSSGALSVTYTKDQKRVSAAVESLSPVGVGFELFDEARLREEIREVREGLIEDWSLPAKPIDPGRYNTVISAAGVAPLLSSTIGSATEVDRVLGHEANATGTSYLRNPSEEVGTFAVGNRLMTVTADRTMKGGAASVCWDDEGVAPVAFPLVQQGIVTDLQTNREGAGWMRDVYTRTQTPVRSRGCAFAPSAISPTMVHTANLRLQSSEGSESEDTMLAALDKGLFFSQINSSLDFQQLSGFVVGLRCYDIKGGKKVARLVNAGALFRTPEFWKDLQVIGGASTARTFGIDEAKGEPAQRSFHSVTAVPVIVKDLSVIDYLRKA